MIPYVWSITSGMYALSAHVQIANVPLNECAPILFQLGDRLRDTYRIEHTTFQFECDTHQIRCGEADGLYCQMEDETHEEKDRAISPIEQASDHAQQKCPVTDDAHQSGHVRAFA